MEIGGKRKTPKEKEEEKKNEENSFRIFFGILFLGKNERFIFEKEQKNIFKI